MSAPRKQQVHELLVLRATAKLLIPFILLFALYVQFHGDIGPAGGFQAGVIFAAGLIMYGLVWGPEALKRVVPPRVVEALVASGLLLYGGVGIFSLGRRKNFLDYAALDPQHPQHGQHLGILLVELGVGVTVCCVMLAIYFAFADRALYHAAYHPTASAVPAQSPFDQPRESKR